MFGVTLDHSGAGVWSHSRASCLESLWSKCLESHPRCLASQVFVWNHSGAGVGVWSHSRTGVASVCSHPRGVGVWNHSESVVWSHSGASVWSDSGAGVGVLSHSKSWSSCLQSLQGSVCVTLQQVLGVTPEQVFRATLEHMTGVTPQQVFRVTLE